MDLKAQLSGAEQIKAKVAQPSPVVRLAEALGIQQITRAVGDAARERAPYETGRLQGAITDKVSGSSEHVFGEVTSPVFYGVFLNSGTWSREGLTGMGEGIYHYRSTKRQGQPTQDWFGGAVQQAQQSGEIDRIMRDLAVEVQRVWEQT